MSGTQDDDGEVEESTEGQNPFSQDEELEQYSEGVRKRIAQETARRSAVERQLAEANERLEVAAKVAQAAVAENKSLKSERNQGDRAILDNLHDKMESDLEIAKREYREAAEEGDAAKTADAIAKLSAASADFRRVQLAKAGYRAPEDAPAPVQPAPNGRDARPIPPRAQEWLSRNTWYGRDPERTRVARAADVYVAAMGFNPNSQDYYEEVDRMVNEKLGSTSGQDRDQRPPSQSTTPSGRSSAPARQAGNGKVALSPSEVAQAKRLGVSVEAYASAKRAGDVVLE